MLDGILDLCGVSKEEKVHIFRENALATYKLDV